MKRVCACEDSFVADFKAPLDDAQARLGLGTDDFPDVNHFRLAVALAVRVTATIFVHIEAFDRGHGTASIILRLLDLERWLGDQRGRVRRQNRSDDLCRLLALAGGRSAGRIVRAVACDHATVVQRDRFAGSAVTALLAVVRVVHDIAFRGRAEGFHRSTRAQEERHKDKQTDQDALAGWGLAGSLHVSPFETRVGPKGGRQ